MNRLKQYEPHILIAGMTMFAIAMLLLCVMDSRLP